MASSINRCSASTRSTPSSAFSFCCAVFQCARASRRAIFAQCLIEAGTVGLAGGIAGLGLAWLGLWAVRQQPADYVELAHLNPTMLLTTFALSIVASLLAGTLPAWMAMQVTPAIQLKSQ